MSSGQESISGDSLDSQHSDPAPHLPAGPGKAAEDVVFPLTENPYDSMASSKKASASGSMPFLHPYDATKTGHQAPSSTRLPNPPSLVAHQQMRFLIMDAPSETNLQLYIKEMEKYSVTDIVRVCDPSYSREAVERHGIRLHELIFPDGDAPPESVVQYWLSLVETRFGAAASKPAAVEDDPAAGGVTIAIHCVAGLGRAPVLVAIALIEAGMSPFDAISFIRERRRGAINTRQLKFLETYRRRGKSAQSKCAIM